MKKSIKPLIIGILLTPGLSFSTVYTFDLQGIGGFGLLPGNVNSVVTGTPGTGGEFAPGILFDDTTNTLTINVAWGSANGFSDLSGNATLARLHSSFSNFPTDTGSAAFTRSGSAIQVLTAAPFTFNSSATSGSISGSLVLAPTLVTQLFNSQFYIDVGTSLNPFREIRGNLVNPTPIPEPSSFAALAGLAGLGLTLSRRRRRA